MAAKAKYQEFHRVLGEVLDSHPNEMAVIKEHLEKQAHTRAADSSLTLQNSKSLIEAAEHQHQLLLSVLNSDRCRNAMQVLADAYAKAPATSQGAPTPRILPAIIIGIMIGVDVCIWAHVGGVTAIC